MHFYGTEAYFYAGNNTIDFIGKAAFTLAFTIGYYRRRRFRPRYLSGNWC